MVLLQRKLYFFKDPEGSNIFQGGPTFSRGVQMLIFIETHITCDFPGGGGPDPLSSPLDPHLLKLIFPLKLTYMDLEEFPYQSAQILRACG